MYSATVAVGGGLGVEIYSAVVAAADGGTTSGGGR